MRVIIAMRRKNEDENTFEILLINETRAASVKDNERRRVGCCDRGLRRLSCSGSQANSLGTFDSFLSITDYQA